LEKKRVNIKNVITQAIIEIKAITLMKLDIPTPIKSEDRRILEHIILPYFSKDDKIARILFVGTEKYTWHYKKIFSKKQYWTIEPRARNRVYGSKRHIIGYLDQIDRYFENNSFDLIICNGVLGYGLNEPKEIESSFEKCYRCLKDNGILVIGWNDIKKWSFLPLEKYKSLQKFEPFYFRPLKSSKYQSKTSNFHTYSFYYKPQVNKKADQL
jgi:SAM-dependent methyltransferase